MRLGQTSAVFFLSRLGSTAFGFLAMVYFARELGSGVLGVYFLVLAMVGWFKLGCNPGITLAVAKRVSEQNAKNDHVMAGVAFVSIAYLLVAGVLVLFRDIVDQYLGEPLTFFVVLMLGIQVFYALLNAVLQGEHLVHLRGILGVTQTIVRVSFQVAAVYVGLGIVGLLAGEMVAYILVGGLGVALLLTYFGRSATIKMPEREHFRSLFDFAKYSWLGTLRGRSYNLMDTIVLGFFVPSSLIGIYAICWNISSILETFAKSLGLSFFPSMSELSSDGRDEEVGGHLSDMLAFAGLFIIPGLAGASVVGRGILGIYGGEFTRGYEVLLILVAAALFHSYYLQFINTLDAIDRPKLTFRINAIFIVTNVALNFVLVYYFGWIGAAVATLLSVVFSLALAYRTTSKLIDFRIPVRDVGSQVISALVMVGFVYGFLDTLRSNGIATGRGVPVLAAVILGVGVYFTCLFGVSTRFRSVLADNLPRLDHLF